MFVNLHCHFTGSYSDSVLRIGPGVAKIAALGQPAVALTDHGEIPFAMEFRDACRRHNVKPLFGAELYFVDDARETIARRCNERFHLVVLAKDRTGLRNLFCLLSDAWTVNAYEDKRGLVDWALLEKYCAGLILLSGCFYNPIGQTFYRRGAAAAATVLRRFRDIFGADFHIEIARHCVPEEERIMAGLSRLAAVQGMVPVVTNDVHYQEPEDWLAHEVLMRTRYDYVIDFHAHSREYWLKSEDELRRLGLPERSLARTAEIAATCEDMSLPQVPRDVRMPLPDARETESLIERGLAAHPAVLRRIDRAAAERHVRDVLGAGPDAGSVCRTIEGLPRASEPDTDHLVYAFGRPLKEFIPLKRSGGRIMTQWDRRACEQAGAAILPVTPALFAGSKHSA
jgi:DNA polymerase-3 subunit alpha